MYSEKQIKLWFEEVRNRSYSDLCLSSNVFMSDMKLIGYSSPFNGNVYINLKFINKNNLSKKAVIGLIAHELAHQIFYRKRSFFSKFFFLWNYWLSVNKRREVEKKADEIAVQRGYGKELIIEIKSEYRCYSNNKKTLEFIKKVYSNPKDIKKLMKKYSKLKK